MNRNSEFQNWLSKFGRAAGRLGLPALLCSAAGWGATLGTVVPLDIPAGGHVSDIVLDEPRGVLYAANFTARRIEVISLTDQKVIRKIDTPAQPGAMALSPDGTSLVVAHVGGDPSYPLFPNLAQACPGSSISIIDPGSGQTRLNICVGDAPLSVAFGNDELALILTNSQIISLDPVTGATQVISALYCNGAVNGLLPDSCTFVRTLPVTLATFPTQILGASIAASGDGFTIFGQVSAASGGGQVLRFRYDVRDKNVVPLPGGASPGVGPITVSVNKDGSRFMAGWGLFDRNGAVVAQFHNPTEATSIGIGTSVIDTAGNASYPYGIIYTQVPDGSGAGVNPAAGSTTPVTAPGTPSQQPRGTPMLMLVDADNLTRRERVQLPENLTGRSVLSAKRDVLYAGSDSGVLVLPVGALNTQKRVAASKQDIVFRPDLCRSGFASQTLDIVNPGGGRVGFAIVATNGGIKVSPSSGFTPQRVTVSVDPGAFQQQNGTVSEALQILSIEAVNVPDPVRVLISNRQADQRGTFLNVPGKLVDVLADPARDRFYVLRQQETCDGQGLTSDKLPRCLAPGNDVLVYDSKNNNLIATLRTSATPTQMTLMMNRKYLLVGHEDSQFAYVYDLDTLQPVSSDLHIRFPAGHYPKSIAASNNTILAASRSAGDALNSAAAGRLVCLDVVDFPARLGWAGSPAPGIYDCTKLTYNTILGSSADGRWIIGAVDTGIVFLFNDELHRVTTARQDFTSLSGAFAASADGHYVVENHLLNSSLVPIKALDTGVNPTSGFVFAGAGGYRTTAPLGPPPPPPTTQTECVFGGTICVTQTLPGTGVATFPPGAITPGSIQTVTNLGPDKIDPSLSDNVRPMRLAEAPLAGTIDAVFTRTLAALRDQSALVLLTQSGLTIMPWSYDVPLPTPQVERIVNSADQTKAVAPGGLISVMGRFLPTALGDACLTVNGATAPLLRSVSATRVDAQLPFDVDGNAQVTLRTAGGSSDTLYLTILPTAPSVFQTSSEFSADGAGALVFRGSDNSRVSASNPVRDGDDLVIYATGLGQTSPAIHAGEAAPADPLSAAVIQPDVSLGGTPLRVNYAGLTPGGVGVYQINVKAPSGLRASQDAPLTIRQGGMSTTLTVPVAVQ